MIVTAKFLLESTKDHDSAAVMSRMLSAVCNILTQRMADLTMFRKYTVYLYIQSVNTILGVSSSYSRERLEADTTAGPFLTIPCCEAKAFMETQLRKRDRTNARVASEPAALLKRDSYERHRKLYYIPGVFNMALQKLRVNCLIFVLASRQVRPCRNEVRIRVVQTASSYNS